jgi:mannose-6-phosphate isomerase-like protein (cupin superfamily)
MQRIPRIPLLLALAAALFAQSGIKVDNNLVRVVLAVDQPHKPSSMHEHTMNRVMVYLDPGRMTITDAAGKAETLHWNAGTVLWSPARGKHISENTGDQPFRIIEVELKAAPAAVTFPALDPVKTDPKHYKVELENEQVRVVRARYGPHEKGALHEHALPRAVVFLTDEQMKVTNPDGAVTEPRARAGDVQFAGTAKHQEENLSEKPFEVIVVEVKAASR